MRLYYLLICSVSVFNSLHAQNVGVGTTNPQATLDVRGTQRVGGSGNYIMYDSATGWIQWVGAALYAPASQQIIRHSASAEGLYAGGGRLEYRNTTAPVFYSDWNTGNGYFKNNLGLNNLNPQFPLSFNGALGDKISLWTDGTSTHYGLGVQSGLLQIFAKTINDDVAFGYGSSNAFTERMRVKGNGNVGIGTNPSYLLDVNGRMRVRSGGNNGTSAGLWLNNNSNTEAAFVGMEDDTHVGLYGANGAGWKFAMNTQTGALQLNGVEGNAGQVLQSNGGSAPSWGSGTNALYNNTVAVTSNTPQIFSSGPSPILIPGLIYTFTVTGNAKLFVAYNIYVKSNGCAGCANSGIFVYLNLNGTAVGGNPNMLNSTAFMTITGTNIFSLGPGTYTITLALTVSNTAVTVNDGGIRSEMDVQVIPQ